MRILEDLGSITGAVQFFVFCFFYKSCHQTKVDAVLMVVLLQTESHFQHRVRLTGLSASAVLTT